MGESGGSILASSAALGWPFMPDLLFNFHLEPIVAWFERKKNLGEVPGKNPTDVQLKQLDRMLIRA